MSNANDMAFPVVLETTKTPNDSEQLGLTKREYFAVTILQGMMDAGGTKDQRAEWAVKQADALLAQLAKPPVG